jgi:hypothetical protein
MGGLNRAAVQRRLMAAVVDTYGAAVPSRRAKVLRALLAEAETAQAQEFGSASRQDLAALVPVARPGWRR